MSYGPQLPPHLQKTKDCVSNQNDDTSDEDQDSTIYGPKLPPELTRKTSEEHETKNHLYGPQMPQELTKSTLHKDDTRHELGDDSDNDDYFVGPLPSSHGASTRTFRQEQIDRQLEERARMIKEKVEKSDEKQIAPKRESWMLELPPEKAKNFGLGPRQFNKSIASKPERDRSWTDTPEIKAKRAALAAAGMSLKDEDSRENEDDKDVLEYMASLKRDQQMEAVANELKKKRGSDSLVELHDKEKSKKKKYQEDSEESGRHKHSERRPFDRDIDLQANRFDEAAKKAMLKNARKLNDKFSSGNEKYL